MGLTRAAVLGDYPALAEELGLNPGQMAQAVGLSPLVFSLPECLISAEAVAQLLEDSAAASACPDFALRLADRRQLSHFGVTSLLLAHQPSLRDTVQAGIDYLHLLNPALALHLETQDKQANLRLEILLDAPQDCPQAVELGVAAILQLMQLAVGVSWHPQHVHFRHPRPSGRTAHARVFRSECRFSSNFDGLSFAAADLDLPNSSADPVMASYARQLVEMHAREREDSMLHAVHRLAHVLLPLGRATIKQVAAILGISVRQLQRDLEAEGVAFSELLEATRRKLVVHYLGSQQLDLGRVAERLGFVQQASFTRWFVRNFDLTPSAWRRRHWLSGT